MQLQEKKIALAFFRNSTHKSQEAKDRMFHEEVWLFDLQYISMLGTHSKEHILCSPAYLLGVASKELKQSGEF